jgi:hypothetical protein
MPLSVTQDGEGSGSRESLSPALRRGRKRNSDGTSTAAATYGITTRSRGREQSARNKLDGIGERLPSEGCRKMKKAKLDDGISRRVSSGRSTEKGKRSQDRLERKAKKRNSGEAEEDEEDQGSCSSAGTSPLHEPYMPDGTEMSKPIDSAISKKFMDMQEKYYQKIGLRFKSLDLRYILKFLYSSYINLTSRRVDHFEVQKSKFTKKKKSFRICHSSKFFLKGRR